MLRTQFPIEKYHHNLMSPVASPRRRLCPAAPLPEEAMGVPDIAHRLATIIGWLGKHGLNNIRTSNSNNKKNENNSNNTKGLNCSTVMRHGLTVIQF